jgi:hypothetical protein
MAMNPKVLVLDEPTAGLDPKGRQEILDMIVDYRRKTGSTVLLVSHSMEDVAGVATKILVMNKSNVAMYDTVENVFSRAEELEQMGLNVPQVTRVFMKLKARSIFLLLALMVVCVFLFPAKAEAAKHGNLTYSVNKDGITISDCKISSSGVITIPEAINDVPVVAIGPGAFQKCYAISGVVIPDSVQSIGTDAFNGCTNLKSITFGSGVKTIGAYAFSGCTKPTKLEFPEGLTSLGNFALLDCTAVTDISIPDSIAYIGEAAFASCDKLNTTTYDNAKYLGSEKNPHAVLMSAKSTDITSCSIHENTRVIGDFAFKDCAKLEAINLPAGLKSIGVYGFYGCSKVSQLTLSPGIIHMGMYAFARCTAIPSVVIPAGISYLNLSVFEGCTALASVTIPEGVEEIGQTAFFDCDSLTEIILPDSVEVINLYAFSNCDKLKKVHLGGELEAIHLGAFHESPAIKEVSYNSIEAQWNAVKVFSDNDVLTAAGIQFAANCYHEFGAWKQADNGHSHTCPFCNTVETEDHNWGEPLIKKPATDEEDGILIYQCEDCRGTMEEAYNNKLTLAKIWQMILDFFRQLLSSLGL